MLRQLCRSWPQEPCRRAQEQTLMTRARPFFWLVILRAWLAMALPSLMRGPQLKPFVQLLIPMALLYRMYDYTLFLWPQSVYPSLPVLKVRQGLVLEIHRKHSALLLQPFLLLRVVQCQKPGEAESELMGVQTLEEAVFLQVAIQAFPLARGVDCLESEVVAHPRANLAHDRD